MNWYNLSKLTKLAQPSGTGVVLGPDTGAAQQWGPERHREYLKTFDVGSNLPVSTRLDNMEKAINTILSKNPPIENEQIVDRFTEIVKSWDVNSKGQWQKIPHDKMPRSISDIFAAARIKNNSIEIVYSETAGQSSLGKIIWSILGWVIPSPGTKNKGPFWNMLQKSGIMQNIEELLIEEWKVILSKGENSGILENYNSSEWNVDTSNVGRDVIVTPIEVSAGTQPTQPTTPRPTQQVNNPNPPTEKPEQIQENELV